MGKGVMPFQLLRRKLIGGGYITGVGEEFINPASIDVPLSGEAYRLPRSFLPKPGQTVRQWIAREKAERHDLAVPLESRATYIVRAAGEWALPEDTYAYANPKSSTGRTGLITRIVADNVGMYDSLPAGWYGEVWMLVRSDYFPIRLAEGRAIAQIRFFEGGRFLSVKDAKHEVLKNGLFFAPDDQKLAFSELAFHGDALYLTLALSERMGYVSRREVKEVLDFRKEFEGKHDPGAFFEPVGAQNNLFNFEKERLYILATQERVRVSPELSAELRSIDVRLGDFKSHAAGYIDPGWGCGKDGSGKGRPITLEVIPYEDMSIQPGQRIARIRYEHMIEPPKVPYDEAGSNYKEQRGAELSKHFQK